MDLVRINEVVNGFGVSSRTLRYYEEVGLLWSSHPENKIQRHYDAAALGRLKQIIVLRKLQIPVKDIVMIFESESMAALIKAFVDKLESLDTEIAALTKLRQMVDEFLHKMMMSGIKKISAITLLYEETEKRLATITDEPVSFEKLSEISLEAMKLSDIRIIRLPPMRVLTSRHKTGQTEDLDEDKMQNLFACYGFVPTPGMRDCFMQKEPDGEWIMLMKIPDDYENDTIYADETLPGGLYAVTAAFFENMDDAFVLLREWVNASDVFDLDSRRPEMLEEILPWDIVRKINKFQQDVFVPIQIKSKEA